MYVPPHFREDETSALHAVMRDFPLATLVSAGAAGLVANHVPMLVVPDGDAYGTLLCHLARPNPQWRDIAAGAQLLAIFCGPDAYVSPSAYATKGETGKVVPTWNYVAVHAYGSARTFEEPDRLHDLVTRLTAVHEAARAQPHWAVDDAPRDYVAGQLRGIVGIEIAISRLIGKWKMSQNRTEADRLGTTADLNGSPVARSRATGEIMTLLEDRRSRRWP